MGHFLALKALRVWTLEKFGSHPATERARAHALRDPEKCLAEMGEGWGG